MQPERARRYTHDGLNLRLSCEVDVDTFLRVFKWIVGIGVILILVVGAAVAARCQKHQIIIGRVFRETRAYLALDPAGERFTLDVLKHHVGYAAPFPHVEKRDDLRALQLRDSSRLGGACANITARRSTRSR